MDNPNPKISIITTFYNSVKLGDFVHRAMKSLLNQTYENIEYIVIDGASRDGTVEIVQSYGDKITKFISEKDKGLYDAMNKGIAQATGDIVGILNSDDFYIDEFVIEKVVKEFEEKKCDSVYADLVYVKPDNLEKTVRYYDSSYFTPNKLYFFYYFNKPTTKTIFTIITHLTIYI